MEYADLAEYFEDEESLQHFAKAVKMAAKKPQTKKFHDRAFIGSIKELWFPRSDRYRFDCQLVAAHIKGFLRLTRADLVGAMDINDVESSEVGYQNATFNFVEI